MTDILLYEAKSKKACPCICKKLIFTNASEGSDESRDHFCVNCDYQFFKDKEQRIFNKLKGQNKDSLLLSMGTFTLLTMLIVILLINTTQVCKIEPSWFKH